jgi:hypothetical protein
MASENSSVDWACKSILIVEDTDTSIMYYKAALNRTKAKLMYAKNGVEALEIVKSGDKIDIILMDINMPIMNGIEATKEIKKINPNIPIIIQTAYILNDERIKSFEAGCDAFIAKPVKINQLFSTLEELL